MPTVVLTPNVTGRDGISHLARLIVRACEPVTVIALHEAPSRTRFEHAAMSAAGGRSARFAALALQHAARCGPDTTVIVVHVHLAPAALAFAARGASLVSCLCGIEAWTPMTWTQRAAIHRSDRVFAISQHTVERFKAANPRFAEREIAVCHPGIACGDARTPSDGAPRALIVGRMVSEERYKGHDELLGVWSDVTSALPHARLEIVGDGDDRARLEAKAAALDAASSVNFLGSVSDDERERAYQRCALLAMPSRDEGFGLVFLEAMRAGRACLAMRGAASEIIEDGRTGWVVSGHEDRAGLTRALISILGDRTAAAEMGSRGRQRFLDRFTEDRFRARLAAVVPESVAIGASR